MPLHELASLAKIRSDQTDTNLGMYIREHVAELALILNIPEALLLEVSILPDVELAPRVLGTLKKHLKAADKVSPNELALLLRESARHCGGLLLLDPRLMLGGMLVDKGFNFVQFVLDDGDIMILRYNLSLSRDLLKRKDLIVYVDSGGVHFRWSGNKGGLNWYPCQASLGDRQGALLVDLSRIAKPQNISDMMEELNVL